MMGLNKSVCLATIGVNQKSVSMFKKNVQASVPCQDEVGDSLRKERKRDKKSDAHLCRATNEWMENGGYLPRVSLQPVR